MELTINQWIDRGKDLPVLSGSIANILNLTNETESDVSQIADVIKKDVSLSAAILRITNSSAFGLFRKITTIDQAVMFLGFKSVRNIALGVGVFNMFPPQKKDFLSKVWQKSIVTGLAARELCNLTGNKKKEDAFTVGLLHDIGLIAFYAYDRQKAANILEKSESAGGANLDDERLYMGLDHVEAGALLAERWRLPKEIIGAMMNHHKEPAEKSCSGDLDHIIYLGSLAGDIFYLGRKTESIRKFTEGCLRLLEISSEDAEKLLQNIHPQLMEVASYFNIAIGSVNTYEDILDRVNEEIISITVTNEAIKHNLSIAFDREKALSTRLEEANRDLKMLASKDPLTGLFNRTFLNELLEKEWMRSRRHGTLLSVILADIDNFKRVNDTYGHQAGDLALQKVADVMKKCLRKDDYLARYGGEEFLFVLPQTGLEEACKAAERLRNAVRNLVIFFSEGKRHSLSISCGVSTALPENMDENIDLLIQRADQALYEAKGAGKNRVLSRELKWAPDFHGLLPKEKHIL